MTTLPFDLAIFLFLGLFTPGPNVIMLFGSGARFGFKATLPHLFGVVIGTGILGFLVGLGVGGLIFAYPALETALRIIAFSWILWLAWRIWLSAQSPIEAGDAMPMRFHEAILFQAVNPKFWSVALAGTAYLIGWTALHQGLTLGGMAASINLFVCLFWVICGHGLSRFLTQSRARLYFYRVMAISLAVSGLMVFF